MTVVDLFGHPVDDRLEERAEQLRKLVNIDAEQALIGHLLIDNRTYRQVSGILQPEHFGVEVHARIYAALGSMIERGDAANPVSLKIIFDADPALQGRGGARYLVELVRSVATLLNAKGYAEVIRDLYFRRRLLELSEDLSRDAVAVSLDRPAEKVFEDHLSAFQEIRRSHRGIDDLVPIDPTMWEGEEIPVRQWLVPDWIPCGVATGLYGPPGYGKTLLVQQLMTAAAVGGKWLGLPVRPVRSLAFLCEDDEDELHRRQAQINEAYGCRFADLARMRPISRLGFDNILMTFTDSVGVPTLRYQKIIEEAQAFGAELVIIDTLADTFGGDQNNMSHARQFVQYALAGIARALGPQTAVIACAHPSLTGINTGSGKSGSEQWDAAFRSRLYLSDPPDEDGSPAENERILTRKKANYAGRGDTIELVWRAGVLWPKHHSTGIIASIERRSCERVFLELLEKIKAEGRFVSDRDRASNYAPKVFAHRPDGERFTKADFERAMSSLFAAKQIRVGTYKGPDRKTYGCIEVVAGGAGGTS